MLLNVRADGHRWLISGLAASILLLGALHHIVPLSEIHLHNFLQHLYFLPIVLAGLSFGWRAALWCSMGVGLLQAPHFFEAWKVQPVYATDLLLEAPVFTVAGLVAGLLANKERRQRANLEATKEQLERVYQELQQNVEELRKAEILSAVGQLSAGLAHEIRNPLASIRGAAGILKRGNASGEGMRDCLEIIEIESQRLNRLLTSFLEFARPKPPRLQPTDFSALIDSVLALSEHANGNHGIAVHKRIDGTLPEIPGDSEQLKQVLLNLVINAIQASPNDGIVEVSAGAQDHRVVVEVRDEGAGILDVDRAHVFEPFFTTKEQGTGLGLAVSSRIVEQHGGRLTAEPNAGKGMTFRLELPLERGLRNGAK